MQSEEIRKRFLEFFEKRGHKILPSASLVPENDPSVLFNTAGMQPIVPYLLGQKHPLGTKLVNIQKCLRTGDLDDIGDNRHFSFFEMMGNWSLGDYFKEKAIEYSYDFLIKGGDKPVGDKGLGLDLKRLYVTVFGGDEYASSDNESFEIWKKQGVPKNRIYFLGADDNWWGAGDTGPCGPSSEMFYDMTGTIGDLDERGFIDATKKGDIIEIWNDVFMTYNKQIKEEHKSEYEELKLRGKPIPKHFYYLTNLPNKNVDTGAGLERITAVMQDKQTAYETDLFKPIMELLIELSNLKKIKPFSSDQDLEFLIDRRIISDHIRASIFLLSDGVRISNKDQGYVLRRIIRRAAFRMHKRINITSDWVTSVVNKFIEIYSVVHPELLINKEKITLDIKSEVDKFYKTLRVGEKLLEKEIEKILSLLKSGVVISPVLSGEFIFDLFTTHGFPVELTSEISTSRGVGIELEKFSKLFKAHQKLSQTASAGMFKGGLANHNEKTVRLHTAHHLLLASLQEMFGKEVKQRGSNITEDRLRMDFTFDRKLTDEEKKKLEDLVNEKIKQHLDVARKEMPLDEAEKLGAEMEFGAKYPEMVSVYFIGGQSPSTPSQGSVSQGNTDNAVSVEFCGGPHVSNTSELGYFKILKEEASSQGVRRIKAVLE